MNTVAQILGSKPGQTVYSTESSASAHEAVRPMAEKSIGALVVVGHGQVVGLVSERDCARKLVLMARSPRDTLLGDIMSTPVMDDGQLMGLISIGDQVKATISEQPFIIEQHEHDITGQRG